MAPFKKDIRSMRPHGNGKGAVHKVAGKGSQQAPLPARGTLNALTNAPGASMNNYAKATPVSQPGGDPSAGIADIGDTSGIGLG